MRTFLFEDLCMIVPPSPPARVPESNPRWTITASNVALVLRECGLDVLSVTFLSDPWDHQVVFRADLADGTVRAGTLTFKVRFTSSEVRVHGEVEFEPAAATTP